MSENPTIRLYRRITNSVPLLVSVVLHAILIAVVGYFVVTETIIGKKKQFASVPPSENTSKKQLDHRIQVARKSGGSSPSPVSAQRIFTTAENALQMPSMTELPQTGASSLAAAGFGAGAGVVGAGSGYNTALGNGSGGRAFMSMNFLGVTNNQISKVVFVIDVGPALMDINKGGFEAFNIIRDEMSRLIGSLPPSSEFGVVLFSDIWLNGNFNLFAKTLSPGTLQNKDDFFAWFKPVNSNYVKIGPTYAAKNTPWARKPLTNAGLDPDYLPPVWADGVRAALEMEPDVIYVVTGSQGGSRKKVSEAELARRKKQADDHVAEMKRQGIDLAVVGPARGKAMGIASQKLKEINADLTKKGKPPLIIFDTRRIYAADFQAKLKSLGYSIPMDFTGWSTKDGKPIWDTGGYSGAEGVEYKEVGVYISRLQRALVKKTAILNIFLFTGPNDKAEGPSENLAPIARRYNGRFRLLTTQDLKEMKAKAEEEEKKNKK